ncbi:PDZ domain-containing protein 8 isoform X2 [Centruroides vittatus]|uniref:PDZ domain-containing protein 8 isoform X2 n=1 Tax=Centruroides vittatus TaxID=120091 RepID=UPI00350EE070
MIFLAISFICVGSIITIVLQFYLIYKFFLRLPICDSPSVPEVVPCQLPEELLKYVEGGDWKNKKESCLALNLVFQFLFREWKDTKVMRRWFLKKISREFLDLQRTTTGKLLERIAIRDLQLGNNLPIIKSVTINDISLHKERKTIEELDMAVVIEYDGGFQLSVDADMVLGRTAFLSVCITKLKGKARLQLTRYPFTHWSISFYNEPYVDFAVESQIQGRPLSQITSLITTQIRRTLRKKHTLPHYKMRFRPFFPLPEPPVYPVIQQTNDELVNVGTLEIGVIGCTRLLKIDSSCQVYCTLALDSSAWVDLVQSQGKSWILLDVEICVRHNQQLGMLFKQEFIVGKYDYCIVVESVIPNSPAAVAGIKKNDIIISIGGTKVCDVKHATKIFKSMGEKFLLSVERQSTLKVSRSQEALNREVLLEEDLLREDDLEDVTLQTSVVDDFVNITFKDVGSQESPKRKPSVTENTLTTNESPKRRVSVGGIVQEFKSTERRSSGDEFENSDLKDRFVKDTDVLDQLNSSKENIVENIESQKAQNVDLKKTLLIKAVQDPVWNEKFLFNITNHHHFLNLGVWSRSPTASPFTKASSKGLKDNFLGHISVPLMPILEECSTTTQGYHIQTFRLQPPDSQSGHRQWKKWAVHSGFDYRLCYGDITLTFLHKPKKPVFESPKLKKKSFVTLKKTSELVKKSQDKNMTKKSGNAETAKRLTDITSTESAAESEDEFVGIEGNIAKKSGAHEFISTHFHSATVCNFCSKKIWLKVAFQCQSCAMICHKKCISRCQNQTSCPPERVKFYLEEIQDGKCTVGYSASEQASAKKEEKLDSGNDSNTNSPNRIQISVSDTPPSSSPGLRKKKLQGLIANLANAGRSKNTMTRTGSAHNLIPPNEHLCPSSKSLPPSPQHSPAQSRKTTSFPWWDPATLEEQDLNSIIEQLLAMPHDEVVLSAAKERGKELYSTLLLEERKSKLNMMIAKLQEAINSEAENRTELARDEHDATDSSQKAKIAFLIAKSDERTQALAVLMLHYLSGLQHCFDQEEAANLNVIKPEFESTNVNNSSDSCSTNLPFVNVCKIESEELSIDETCFSIENDSSKECKLLTANEVDKQDLDNKIDAVQENGWNNENMIQLKNFLLILQKLFANGDILIAYLKKLQFNFQ